MIVTHTQNAAGQCRVYLGGKSSIECWIEPRADGTGWTFHIENAVGGVALSLAEKRQWALHSLQELAAALNTAPAELWEIPFDTIAALHTSDPYLGRRVASPKRRVIENGFTSTCPLVTKPRADFGAHDYARARQKQH